METQIENKEETTVDYSTNTHEMLLSVVVGLQELIKDKILEVLQNPNDLTAFENDFWASRGSILHYQIIADIKHAQILFDAKGWSEFFEDKTGDNKNDTNSKTN